MKEYWIVYDKRRVPLLPFENGNKWELLEGWDVNFMYHEINIPKGFVTDFASVPRFLWALIPRWGKHGHAAILHDYMCRHRIGNSRTRDQIMFQVMTDYETKFLTKWTIYIGLRLFGWTTRL